MPRFPYHPYDPLDLVLDEDYYYDPFGYRLRREPRIMYADAPSPVVVSSPIQQPAQAVYQHQQAAPVPDINVVIPHGDPFGSDDSVVERYLAESHRVRGLQPGLGEPRHDAEEIVDMMAHAANGLPERVLGMGRERAIAHVMRTFARLGYNVPGVNC